MGQETIKNRTIFHGDNLEVMRGMDSNSIDLIYIDPPFNKNRMFIAPIGSSAEGASFKDIWGKEDVKDEEVGLLAERHPALHQLLSVVEPIGTRGIKYYLLYMGVRLLEMHRILKDTGSLYLHCDHTVGHYLKLLLDCIFGEKHFRNHIAWCYTGPGSPGMRQFNRKHDIIFWYSKGEEWIFNRDAVRVPYKDPQQSLRRAMSTTGEFDHDEVKENRKRGKVPETWWYIRIAARSKSEYTGYPTQKPLALLDRIIKASSHKGDMVLDAFCGCATTCVSAERLGRQWVGIDVSEVAYGLVRERLNKQQEAKGGVMFKEKIYFREKGDIPVRTDIARKFTKKRDLKRALFGKQEGICSGCRRLMGYVDMEIDHIVPKAVGGSDDDGNKQLLCGFCNKTKGDRGMDYLAKRLRELAMSPP